MLTHSSENDEIAPDLLSAVLQDLRVARASYGLVDLSAPWGIAFPPQDGATFHLVLEGRCWLRKPDRDPRLMVQGEAALIPGGGGHVLADTASGPTVPLDGLPREEIGDEAYRLHVDGGGDRTRLVCCTLGFDEPNVGPLMAMMPEVLYVGAGDADDPTNRMLLSTMASEMAARRIGTATVMTRLADVLVVRVLRTWVETQSFETTGWIAAIWDPQIGPALAAIHRSPGDPWSVRALAEVANLARSTFSERFTSAVGISPGRYLAQWRVQVASTWLRTDRLSVAEVAERLGYESESSFNRAFKRLMGVPPGAWRRGVRQSSETSDHGRSSDRVGAAAVGREAAGWSGSVDGDAGARQQEGEVA